MRDQIGPKDWWHVSGRNMQLRRNIERGEPMSVTGVSC